MTRAMDASSSRLGVETLDDAWPLFGLALRSERLELRLPADDDLVALAAVARRGIHDPDVQPFTNLWTDRSDDEWYPRFLQYFWSQRARLSPSRWELPFAVRFEGELVGVQQLTTADYRVLGVVGTGSWLSRAVQRRGIGREMRAAVLSLAFDHLGARAAITAAYDFNAGSIGVSRSVGCEDNGVRDDVLRGAAAEALLFRMTAERWRSLGHPRVEVEGLERCLPLLGLEPARRHEEGGGA